MTKIVYNACFGGFGLSHEAMLKYAEKRGITLYFKGDEFNLTHYYTSDDNYFSDRDIPRTDPDLAAVVEELGEAASGNHANLAIRELPMGTKYRIDEYDGHESVITIDEYDWETA